MLGIVILNYNTFNETIECIDSILSSTTVGFCIYIVDNCSNDGSSTKLNDMYESKNNIFMIHNTINSGYAAGNNIGIKTAITNGCDYILIVNPDVKFKDNCIEILLNYLSSNDEYGVCSPKILSPENKYMQFALKKYTFNAFIKSKKPFIFLNSFNNSRFFKYDICKPFEFYGMTSGCCFMIKSDTIKKIDFFDENTFLFYEEEILSYKLIEIQKTTCIIPEATVIHNHSTSIKKENKAFTRYHRFLSSKYVLIKYAKINLLEQFLVFLIHDALFIFLSVFKEEYRCLLKPLLKKKER